MKPILQLLGRLGHVGWLHLNRRSLATCGARVANCRADPRLQQPRSYTRFPLPFGPLVFACLQSSWPIRQSRARRSDVPQTPLRSPPICLICCFLSLSLSLGISRSHSWEHRVPSVEGPVRIRARPSPAHPKHYGPQNHHRRGPAAEPLVAHVPLGAGHIPFMAVRWPWTRWAHHVFGVVCVWVVCSGEQGRAGSPCRPDDGIRAPTTGAAAR